jgi:hypothetical protein
MSAASTSSFPFLESAAFYALALNGVWVRLWDYRPAMPTARLGRETVGLAPVAQITLLPAASLWLAGAFPAPFLRFLRASFATHILSQRPLRPDGWYDPK